MKKIALLIMTGMTFLFFTQTVGAYSLSNGLLTIEVNEYGKVTTMQIGGTADLLNEQSHFVKIGTDVLAFTGANFTYNDSTTIFNSAAAYLKTEINRNWDWYWDTQTQRWIGKQITISIESKIMPGTPYFDQRINFVYQSGSSTQILSNVRHFVLVSAESVYNSGYVKGSIETAATSNWQCVKDTTSSWKTPPSQSLTGDDWVDHTDADPFLSIEAPSGTPGAWALGSRGQSSIGDDFFVGNYADVFAKIMSGGLTPPPTPAVPFTSGPYSTNPSFARQWNYGPMSPYPGGPHPYAYRTDVRTEATPEPATMLLLGVGTGLLGLSRRMRKGRK